MYVYVFLVIGNQNYYITMQGPCTQKDWIHLHYVFDFGNLAFGFYIFKNPESPWHLVVCYENNIRFMALWGYEN